jgi:hypothetical protein
MQDEHPSICSSGLTILTEMIMIKTFLPVLDTTEHIEVTDSRGSKHDMVQTFSTGLHIYPAGWDP